LFLREPAPITSADQVLNVPDFEPLARITRGARNNETLRRAMAADNRHCVDCHVGNSHDMWRSKPMFSGLDVSHVTALAPPDLSIGFLDRLRAIVKGRMLVKGVVTGEDAALAVEHGADGIVVSNHGGRNEETLRATIDCLPEIVASVKGRVPIFIDGGIRRGTDIFKAFALGATAVGIGRPQAFWYGGMKAETCGGATRLVTSHSPTTGQIGGVQCGCQRAIVIPKLTRGERQIDVRRRTEGQPGGEGGAALPVRCD
jgi:hypothetical protein